jgi:hypothetical protein
VQASVQRAAEVEAKVTGDPKAAQREAMRKLGLTEDQIIAALGPEPKPEPKEDPKRVAMRQLGLTEAQIDAALGITSRGSDQPQAEIGPMGVGGPAEPAQPRRGRKPKAVVEATPAAPEPTEPVQAAPEAEVVQDTNADEPAPGAIPAEFDALLASMLGQK